MVGFQMLDRAVARGGYAIYQEGECMGSVTSGAPSPSLKCSIGFASISSQITLENEEIDIEIRGRLHSAKIDVAIYLIKVLKLKFFYIII